MRANAHAIEVHATTGEKKGEVAQHTLVVDNYSLRVEWTPIMKTNPFSDSKKYNDGRLVTLCNGSLVAERGWWARRPKRVTLRSHLQTGFHVFDEPRGLYSNPE